MARWTSCIDFNIASSCLSLLLFQFFLDVFEGLKWPLSLPTDVISLPLVFRIRSRPTEPPRLETRPGVGETPQETTQLWGPPAWRMPEWAKVTTRFAPGFMYTQATSCHLLLSAHLDLSSRKALIADLDGLRNLSMPQLEHARDEDNRCSRDPQWPRRRKCGI